jgi:hypothetical protein
LLTSSSALCSSISCIRREALFRDPRGRPAGLPLWPFWNCMHCPPVGRVSNFGRVSNPPSRSKPVLRFRGSKSLRLRSVRGGERVTQKSPARFPPGLAAQSFQLTLSCTSRVTKSSRIFRLRNFCLLTPPGDLKNSQKNNNHNIPIAEPAARPTERTSRDFVP